MKTSFTYPWHVISSWIDRTNMYRIMLYGLGGLSLYSIALSFGGVLTVDPYWMVTSLIVLILSSFIASVLCGKIFKVVAHHQSSVITALILFFLLSPAATFTELVVLVAVAALSVLSKYIFVYKRQHLVNAAAVAVWLVAVSGYGAATWWVATPLLVVPLVVAGVMVVSKVRAWPLFLSFVGVGLVTFGFEEWRFGNDITATWSTYFLAYPTLFLGFFMLTEPFTLPPTRSLKMGYGALVGFLSSTALFVPFFSMTPELALLLGNLAAYPYTLRQKLYLRVISVREIGALLYEVTFEKPRGLTFVAGQYLEWMLPHRNNDTRGIRRYFTILSSPTEPVVRLACKVPTPGSTYKQALVALRPGDTVIASQLAGDFVLPKQVTEKIGWVAGGIGVTPFVSQSSFLLDTNEKRNIALLYAANKPEELVYRAQLEKSTTLIPVLASGDLPGSESGYITADIIKRRVSDYAERTWYVSGPPGMVSATVKTLEGLGIPGRHIVKDFFPGLA